MNEHGEGRLSARPAHGANGAVVRKDAGLRELGLGTGRDGLVLVPSKALTAPAPLIVGLHGAGGDGGSCIARLQGVAAERGVIVLAPDSRGATWDVLQGGFGPDVSFIDRCLGMVFEENSIDPKRIAIEGFSDGASYALSLGITNGDLFRTIIALSPGFAAAAGAHGKPRVWISHGTEDRVLPIDGTSRRLAPALERSGFNMRYTEFEGGHTAPAWLTKAAVDWWLGADEDV
jgi:phospholipase/carboxylesterase